MVALTEDVLSGFHCNKFIESYLSKTQQFVYANDIKSNTRYVTCSVPQGSTLGPIRFLLYINNLPSVTKFNTLSFADDTTLTLSNGSVRELEKFVNSELTSIVAWMQANKLTINFEKINFILFGDKAKNTV